MKKIGITGNIGSGKTFICQIFASMGIPIAYADDIAKELMRSRLHIRHELLSMIGMEAFTFSGGIDRKEISNYIFSDQKNRKRLEQVVHPAVQAYLTHWFESHAKPYAIEEAALIFESGSHHWLDAVIWVDAPEDLRMKRVLSREGMTPEAFEARNEAQGNTEKKKNLADFIIINDGEHSLIQQIADIHQQILHNQ